MEYGFVLPKLISNEKLLLFVKSVESLGFHSIWASDHVVLPIERTNLYPYTDDGSFTASPEDPQLDALILLSFLYLELQFCYTFLELHKFDEWLKLLLNPVC